MADRKNLSNTQEINSILEEARKNRAPKQTAPKPVQKSAPQKPKAPQATKVIDDDFVIIDDGRGSSKARTPQSKPKKKKKSKAGLIVALSILGVLILVAAGGFTWYMLSGSSTMADNISVNGVSLAGMTMEEAKKALAPVESSLAEGIKVEIKGPADKVVNLTKEDFKYSFNTEQILRQAQEYSEEKGIKRGEQTYTLTMTLDQTSCKEAAEKVAKEFNAEAKDAKVTSYDSEGDGTFTYQDDVVGVSVNVDELTSAIAGAIKDKPEAQLNAPYDEVKAKYTKEFLQKNIRMLSEFTTTSTNSSNGNHNMATSLDACDGSIIDPDEVWSFNECTGDSNQTSNGYLPAGVIVEGRHETGVGGGICQSSTTIYNAAILCGMEVEERSCHYYKSVYVDAGRDATVDYGNLDLKVSNPFDTQLFMKCYMDGVVLHCEMYGVPQESFDEIEITTETTSSFSNGYRVSAERHYYKDGKEVMTDDLPNSTYYTSAPSSGNSDDDDDDDDDDSGSTSSSGSSGSSSGGSSGSGTSSSGGSDSGSSDDGGGSGDGGSGDGGSGDGGSSDDGGSGDGGGSDDGGSGEGGEG